MKRSRVEKGMEMEKWRWDGTVEGDGEGDRKAGRVMDKKKEMGIECEGCERCGESKRLMGREDGQRGRRGEGRRWSDAE